MINNTKTEQVKLHFYENKIYKRKVCKQFNVLNLPSGANLRQFLIPSHSIYKAALLGSLRAQQCPNFYRFSRGIENKLFVCDFALKTPSKSIILVQITQKGEALKREEEGLEQGVALVTVRTVLKGGN